MFFTRSLKKKYLFIASTFALSGYLIIRNTFYASNKEKDFKENLIILGTGWGSVNFIDAIDTQKYNITIVSPRNYFLFTPLLPSTTTGSVESRTITEPIRNLIRKKDQNIVYYESSCTNIDIKNQVITCQDLSGLQSSKNTFQLNYDKLVIAVGSRPNTFGTKGVEENTFFLKNLEDGVAIRNRIIDALETANLPHISKEERDQLCSFLIVGGGPTGVEFAGELEDLKDDLIKAFPKLKEHFKVTMIQSADHILNTYSEDISKYAESKFKSEGINLITNARVLEVFPKHIEYINKKENKKVIIPYGICVWSTGIKPIPLSEDLIKIIPNQNNKVALTTDNYLKVKGVENVYAIGDCCTVESNKLVSKMMQLFKEADKDGNGKISIGEFENFVVNNKNLYPQLKFYQKRISNIFDEFDLNKDGVLDEKEFEKLLQNVDKSITSYPPTAQVASQQGTYLAKYLSGKKTSVFHYNHKGSFANLGAHSSVLDAPNVKLTGLSAWFAWKGCYFTKQLSLRGKFNLGVDWIKSSLFGRDISRQ